MSTFDEEEKIGSSFETADKKGRGFILIDVYEDVTNMR